MKAQKLVELLIKVKIQIILIGIVSFFYILSILKIIPNSSELFSFIKTSFQTYGIWIICITSFFENLFGINIYVPGAVVILTGMSLTHGNLPKAILTFIFIYIPVIIANSINFYIGKKTKTISEEKTNKRNISMLLSTLWHPYLASISSFQLGTQKLSFIKFLHLFMPISFLWNIIWGIIAYNSGTLFEENSESFFLIFVIYLLLWLIIDLIKQVRISNKNKKT